jgi:hypothetical protein
MSKRLITSIVIALFSLAMINCVRESAHSIATLRLRLDNKTGAAERRSRQARMREFLWDHWRGKQQAWLMATYISKEGKQTDVQYDIRLVRPSTWIMVVTTTRYRYGHNGQIFRHEDDKYDIYSVERVKPDKSHLLTRESRVEVLPTDARYDRDEYCLRLIGWGGEVQSFF